MSGHERNPLVRWGKKIEPLAHRAKDHQSHEHDHGKKPQHQHHESHEVCIPKTTVTENEQTKVIVNVNVGPISGSCCPPQPGGGTTGPGTSGGTTTGGRPTHTTGTTDGHIAKDTGARPIIGVFWESPDIIILPGVHPSVAPSTPPEKLGGYAKAGVDNTVYAHVWNLGQAPYWRALVEFFWFNPTMGFDGKDANLIGFAHVDLNGRGARGCHKLVKCPNSWKAAYVNGGHECVVVRISYPVKDPLSEPPWGCEE
ncbi:hypothetical protein DL95DRAFT_467304 [Leptodontidium sp. 2 PMI_412]|nr:hypothetical protein DL95DRAFT_467304 [Leptodontidium sp. 2 PMI_412]